MRYVPPGRPRPAIGWSGSRRLPRVISSALAVIVAVLLLVPGEVRAAGSLSNGSVTPGSGTTSTVFVFSVDYLGDPDSPATNVRALVAGMTVHLALASGTAIDGTYSGSRRLPAGSWPVTFVAATSDVEPLAGPTVVVTAPSPTPAPTPSPTAVPTPRPTPRPTPSPPSNSPPPPTATARPTPRPGSSTPTAPPGATAAPGATAVPAGSTVAPPAASGSASASATAESSSSPDASGSAPAASPSSSQPPDPAAAASTAPRSPWLFVGGGMSALGAAILAGQWARRRRAGPTGP